MDAPEHAPRGARTRSTWLRHDFPRLPCDARTRSRPHSKEPSTHPTEPAHNWLKGTAPLDPVAALNLWNLALDIGYTLEMNFNPVGRWADACYGHLLATNVPYLMDEHAAAQARRWPAMELRHLRRILGGAVHVLRIGLDGHRPRHR